MDLWLIAATAATGYVTKHLQNVSKGESSSKDLTNVKLESPRSLASQLARVKESNEENFEACLNGETLDISECGNVFEVQVASSNEEYFGSNDKIPTGSFGNRAFLRRNQRHIKPFSMEKTVMSRLHREKFSVEEYMHSSFPSPCGSVLRPLLVTDGRKVISNNTKDSISQHVPECGIPQLRKLESSVLYAKRGVGNAKSASRRSDYGIGSDDAVMLLCVGISIGIMSAFVANQTELNKVRVESKRTDNLVKDLEDELETKDSLTVKDDLHSGDGKTAEKSESISKIEAELEAELERLEINISTSNIETKFSDIFELEPDFEEEFAQGELRDDLVERQCFGETETNQEWSGNSTPASGNYIVSPRELSLRLLGVINSRYERRIKELEIALQESERKLEQLVMEAEEKKRPLIRTWESHEVMNYKRDSNIPVCGEKKHSPAEIQPLVMNLAGGALDAFNESYEELMDINDYLEEDDLQCEMQETERQEELSLTSKSSPWSHKDYRKGSSRTSEDVNFSRLQDLLGVSDEEEEEEDEIEKHLIKQIVEKTKQGSSAVFNAQKMLFLMEDIEQHR
ncbi:hypothetical protein CARUB_v10003171mg [Capsella rubella]|uniref:Uncharacterized protein n=1 Tax=Capsella rubella TaxID=81985 RepID=R0FJD7_9BRAS|nr:uncharacterized protein LOC17881168 [Capsella rubella]EOA22517.1 hypothetical protein CARUB_v10003171mg [Capsella rubella]